MNKLPAPHIGTRPETKQCLPSRPWARFLASGFTPRLDLARHVFAAILLLGVFYRLRLTWALLHDPAGTALLRRGAFSWSYLLRFTFGEMLLALLVAGVVFVLQALWWGSARLAWLHVQPGGRALRHGRRAARSL